MGYFGFGKLENCGEGFWFDYVEFLFVFFLLLDFLKLGEILELFYPAGEEIGDHFGGNLVVFAVNNRVCTGFVEERIDGVWIEFFG